MCVEEAGLVPPCNPVKHLDNGGTAGLAFLHSAAYEWRRGCMCAAFRLVTKNGKRWTEMEIDVSIYLSFSTYLSVLSVFLPPLGHRWCSLGPGVPPILMVKYWHRCCGKIERPTCAISPTAGPGSSRGRLL